MDDLLARPESLILDNLPLPPSGTRICEMDFGSSIPRAHTVGEITHFKSILHTSFRTCTIQKELDQLHMDITCALIGALCSVHLFSSDSLHLVRPFTWRMKSLRAIFSHVNLSYVIFFQTVMHEANHYLDPLNTAFGGSFSGWATHASPAPGI